MIKISKKPTLSAIINIIIPPIINVISPFCSHRQSLAGSPNTGEVDLYGDRKASAASHDDDTAMTQESAVLSSSTQATQSPKPLTRVSRTPSRADAGEFCDASEPAACGAAVRRECPFPERDDEVCVAPRALLYVRVSVSPAESSPACAA